MRKRKSFCFNPSRDNQLESKISLSDITQVSPMDSYPTMVAPVTAPSVQTYPVVAPDDATAYPPAPILPPPVFPYPTPPNSGPYYNLGVPTYTTVS